jgi:hypothetical protein
MAAERKTRRGRPPALTEEQSRQEVFRYRLYTPDMDDLGEATYAMMIHAGEEIIADKNQRFRVVDVVLFEEEDESPFVALLTAEPSQGRIE